MSRLLKDYIVSSPRKPRFLLVPPRSGLSQASLSLEAPPFQALDSFINMREEKFCHDQDKQVQGPVLNFDLIFKQYREESSIRSDLLSHMQWHNGIINHRHSIASNSMHQMKHTTLFEPQLSWPDIDLRTAYGNMFVTNAYVKLFALLTKPKESLTT